MKTTYDLSQLEWTVEGYTPNVWLFERRYGGMGAANPCIDVRPVPATVPGSVQGALRQAGLLPDWNIAENWRACEWVENRHWMYRTHLPDAWLADHAVVRLECQGLDYSGWVYLNQQLVASFVGTHVPHVFDLAPFIKKKDHVLKDNVLEIVFDLPPRWLGQFGYTSRMTEWKTRFNYTWDWSPRLVQVGIWDSISLSVVDGSEIQELAVLTDANVETGTGSLEVRGQVVCAIPAGQADFALAGKIVQGAGEYLNLTLEKDGNQVLSAQLSLAEFKNGFRWEGLPVALWWPNLEGEQPLYTLTCRLMDAVGREHDRVIYRVGFKHIAWQLCEGAPAESDPWVCVVNGRPVFLQGVNFAPLSALFADLTQVDYTARLKQYHELGLNCFRINACQFLERNWFYDLCDELGLLVWQEFPLTSSGIENWPPEDAASQEAVVKIARSFIERRRHHASMLLWSGGNEQQGDFAGNKTGIGKPCDLSHPLLGLLGQVVGEVDPIHRYIPTSPLGPRAGAEEDNFGKGLHWDVHGPNASFESLVDAERYWFGDDALFRAEVYCSGSSPVGLIEKYAGEMDVFPATADNPYWTRLTTWWLDWHRVTLDHGREPADLAEYVAWSQARQAEFVSLGLRACKRRFPRCGGFLLWSGHDTYPLTINTSLIDYDGGLKPVARAVSQVWHTSPGKIVFDK